MYRSTLYYFEVGSALVEFTFLLSVLLPIGLGMAMLGKMTDLKQSAEQASRYSAWESTVYSRQALLAQQSLSVEQRFFSAMNVPISSISQPDNAGHPAKKTSENMIWGRQTGGKVGFREMGNVSRSLNNKVTPSITFDTGKAAAALLTGNMVEKAGLPLSRFKGNSWDIVADGLLRSTVNVPIRATAFLQGTNTDCGKPVQDNASAPANGGGSKTACVRSTGVILADGWGASGDAQAISRIRSLVPGSTLSKVGKGVGKLLGSTIFPELDPLDKAFGHVDMRVLPRYAKP